MGLSLHFIYGIDSLRAHNFTIANTPYYEELLSMGFPNKFFFFFFTKPYFFFCLNLVKSKKNKKNKILGRDVPHSIYSDVSSNGPQHAVISDVRFCFPDSEHDV